MSTEKLVDLTREDLLFLIKKLSVSIESSRGVSCNFYIQKTDPDMIRKAHDNIGTCQRMIEKLSELSMRGR